MNIDRFIDKWINSASNTGEYAHAPVTYHVQVAPELSRMLEVYAAAESKKPETIIAEALRRYLGADQ